MKAITVAGKYGIGLFAAAALLAGCNGGANPSLGSASSPMQNAHRVHSLQTVSTKVAIYNSGSVTIAGTGSDPCWSISPGLPSVSGGSTSSPITLTYNVDCIATDSLDISYGPIVATANCTFVTTYNGGFSYKAVNSVLTDCTVAPSKVATYNELFSYDPAGSLRRRH